MTRVKLSNLGRFGLNADLPSHEIPPESFSEVRNVRFNTKGAQAFGGDRVVLSAAPFSPLWLKVFPPVQAPIWVYAGLTRVGAFDQGHVDITRLSEDYTAVTTERWQGEVFQGLGIFNNTVDVPQLWSQFSVGIPLVDLPFWPSDLRCKFIRPFKNFLISGYMTESGEERPYRVRWSHSAAPGTIPNSWALDDPTKDSGEKDIAETDDYIVDGLKHGELFILYKQKSAYAMQFVGRPDIFAHWNILPTKGLLARDCVTAFPGGHFVAGNDDIYVHTGQRGSETSVVEAKMRDWIYNQIDASNYQNCYNVDYQRRNEIWFCFPEAGETYPTLAAVWNRITGGMGIREIQRSPFIYAGPVDVAQGDDTWDFVFYILVEDGENLVQEDLKLILAE